MGLLRHQIRKGCEMPDVSAAQSGRAGQIVTFYSFKGGTGRTMALANVAWILAANGMRVLIADWDLESPGLHRFFQPFMASGVGSLPGVVDFIRKYAWQAKEEGERLDALESDAESDQVAQDAITQLIDKQVATLSGYVVPVDWRFPEGGVIDFLSPGSEDGVVYETTLGALDWDNLYDTLYGGEFFDALRAHLKRTYDWVLIDSRTGLSDIADICTLHLPDMVVDCFTLSTQGIEGAARVAKLIQRNTDREITILPVPMRIDHTEKEKVAAGIKFVERHFDGLPANMPPAERRQYWAEVEVPYKPEYAYEETLAAFGDRPGATDSLLSSYERIAARITANKVTRLPPRQEWLRLRTWRKFSRTPSASPSEVVLDFSPLDQLWGEWIAAVLASAGLEARLVGEQVAGGPGAGSRAQAVAVVSDAYLAGLEESAAAAPAAVPDLLILVTDTNVPPGVFDRVPAVSLVGLSEAQAVDRLIDRFDGSRPAERDSVTGAMRYPARTGGQIDNIETRNPAFTGRDALLRQLREELRSRRRVVVLQELDIKGLGGVGKTQVAKEYAHRFKADYDVVWWLNCGQPQYIDASLVDLGKKLRAEFGATVPEEGGAAPVVEQVLRFLSERADIRWLLIYDNAEEIEAVAELLPAGGGHVLITSRNDDWEGQSAQPKTLRMGFFDRQESISHLRRRVPSIAVAEADELAQELGDMPLAVATAGALLASEKMTVWEYRLSLDRQPIRPLPPGHDLLAYPASVVKAWHLSLDVLEQRSAAAALLLSMWAVMAPETSFDLTYSDAMVDRVRGLDSDISDSGTIAKLVKQIDMLALIRVDYNARQIHVHRVVQTVMRERLSEAELRTAEGDVHQLLLAARRKVADVETPGTWSAYRQIWPHLRPSKAELSAHEQVRNLLVDRVRYMRARDDLDAGHRRALEIERAWTGLLATGPDPAMAGSLRTQLYRLRFTLANIMRELGQFEASRELDEAVLDAQRKQLGDEHPHTLQTRSSLAADRRALGEYQEALKLDQATYDSWSQNSGFGEEYPGTLSAANNLALSSLLNGDFRGALRRDTQTRRGRAALLGTTHPRTLHSGTAVARDLLELGRYQESARTLAEVVQQSVAELGEDARITLTARLWLGIAQGCVADGSGAATANIEAATTGLIRAFGPESNDALTGRLAQALNQLTVGQVERGRKAAEEVLTVYEGRLGAAHPNVLICRLNVATALCLQEDYVAARTQAERAADGLAAALGADHPYTLSANMVLGNALVGLGELEAATSVEELVVDGREKALGQVHPDTLRGRANLLLTLRQRGINPPATARQQVLAELSDLLGPEHPDVVAVTHNRRLLCIVDLQPF
jgi:MinD-like ATPase involved in chromosome partitioning or flagellar assembly/tetratricopeptide (TPR) repeat protein